MFSRKVANMLSIAAKGGNIVSGEFSVERAVKCGKAYLVICAKDSSDNTKKHFNDMCTYYKVPFIYFETKDNLGRFIGKEMRACVACIDPGISNTIIRYMDDNQAMTGGKVHA